MIWEKIRGHDELVGMFRRSMARGRLSHAYLFTGPDGVGKKLFAKTLAQCLFCERFNDAELEACGECSPCRMMQAGTHPDYLTLAKPEGKNVIPIELVAGTIDRRGREGFCHDISLRPMAGNRRVAVIDDADFLHAESANALLKTLEEPPPGSILILISTNSDSQLPTIRSRCQPVRFGALPKADVVDLLMELEIASSREEAESAAQLSDGSLTAAIRLLDPKLLTLRDVVCAGLAAEPYRGAETAAKVQGCLEEIGGDAPEQRQLAIWVIRFAAEFWQSKLRQIVNGSEAADAAESLELLAELIDRAVETEEQIAGFTSASQALEGLFLSVGHRSRAAAK